MQHWVSLNPYGILDTTGAYFYTNNIWAIVRSAYFSRWRRMPARIGP